MPSPSSRYPKQTVEESLHILQFTRLVYPEPRPSSFWFLDLTLASSTRLPPSIFVHWQCSSTHMVARPFCLVIHKFCLFSPKHPTVSSWSLQHSFLLLRSLWTSSSFVFHKHGLYFLSPWLLSLSYPLSPCPLELQFDTVAGQIPCSLHYRSVSP